MSKRYSGKSFKDSSVMKKPKLSLKEKRKLKKEKKKNLDYLFPTFAQFGTSVGSLTRTYKI